MPQGNHNLSCVETFMVMMLATVQLHDHFGAGRGFTCLKCGTAFSNSSDGRLYSLPHKETFWEKWFGNDKSNATQLSLASYEV